MTDAALFAIAEPPPPPDPDRYVTDDMGANAARTARRRAMIEDGIHPATRLPIHGEATCGDCAHLWHKMGQRIGSHWWKCRQVTRNGPGDGPDMVKSWPSCTAFTPKEKHE